MKKTLYIDMDGVLVDFGSALPRVSADEKRTFDGRLDEVPGIFSLMDPVADAIDYFIYWRIFSTPIFCPRHLGRTLLRGRIRWRGSGDTSAQWLTSGSS